MAAEFLWVDNPSSLSQLVDRLKPGRFVALDTEADSLHHYRESVCLVQLTQDRFNGLIDPLSSVNLSPLWQKLAGQKWILHGADFDLRMLRRIGAQEPESVFDTMIAAQLLGIPAFSYAALAELYYGVKLNKKSQKSDWSRRPLTEAMLDYAVQDTQYLEGFAEKMGAQLRDMGREEWHRQSSARVVTLSRQPRENDDEDPWRIRGANALTPGALAILKSIWHWREAEAERSDVPVFKVQLNEGLLRLATWADENRSLPPPAWSGWPGRISAGRSERMIAAVEDGRRSPPIDRLPHRARPHYDHNVVTRMEKLRKARDEIAAGLKLDATLLASKLLIQLLAKDPAVMPQSLLDENRWCQWQWDLLSDALKSA